MPQLQPLDYAVPSRTSTWRLTGLVIAVLLFASIEVPADLLLVSTGNDRTPGNWNDLVVLLALNPGGHILAGLVFVACSFFLRRRFQGQLFLYILAAILVPLVGAVVVGKSVHH